MQVRMQGIGKAFGPVHVLEGVDFNIAGGEVHALMGEKRRGQVHVDENPVRLLCSRRGSYSDR